MVEQECLIVVFYTNLLVSHCILLPAIVLHSWRCSRPNLVRLEVLGAIPIQCIRKSLFNCTLMCFLPSSGDMLICLPSSCASQTRLGVSHELLWMFFTACIKPKVYKVFWPWLIYFSSILVQILWTCLRLTQFEVVLPINKNIYWHSCTLAITDWQDGDHSPDFSMFPLCVFC